MLVLAAASCKSFAIASKLVARLLSVEVSAKQLSLLTTMIGNELESTRDEQTALWQNRLLTTPKTVADPPPQLACIQIDGGRVQTRSVGLGLGVFNPHWRETKNAGFHRMSTGDYSADPHPDLPSCFFDRKNMGKLLNGVEHSDSSKADAQSQFPSQSDEKPDFSWRPEPLFRTCLASLCDSDTFGSKMAAEADRRGFFTAHRRAFLADGLPYNWSIHQQHFETFEPILDFIHPLERIHEVSRALEPDAEAAWLQTTQWMEECWQGNIKEVIGLLRMKQLALGLPSESASPDDSRRVLQETIVYLENNQSRMDYPRYRQQGLPITSCLIESQVKEMNYRIKGTEKFWNDGTEAEAILQVTAAIIGDDDQLAKHFQCRKGSPYDRITKPK